MTVYKRTYTEKEIEALTGAEREAYDKKNKQFDKALRQLRDSRDARERKAALKAKKNQEKRPAKRGSSKVGDEAQAVATKGKGHESEGAAKDKAAASTAAQGSGDGSTSAPAAAPSSPLKRWLGFGRAKKTTQGS